MVKKYVRAVCLTTGIVSLLFTLVVPEARGAMELTAAKAGEAPVIDGSGDDDAWKEATAVTIQDQRTKEDVILKSVQSGDMVYFLVRFPDAEENRLHKPWVWEKEMGVYKLGPQREDGFTFKWNMEDREIDLSNFSDDDYTADVWYWKANRTDPAGYADDKSHVLASEPGKKAKELTSSSGKTRYLMRLGDSGKAAQKKRLLTDYQGDLQDQYESATPDGSRADVLARGAWKEGQWTVEFGRKLDTGQSDDVRMEAVSGNKYLFGVSIFGLYGEDTDDSKPHLYGQGRLSEKVYLLFP